MDQIISTIDCSHACNSRTHLIQIAKILRDDPDYVKAIAISTCRNFMRIKGLTGQTLVHLCAAAGQTDVMDWLLGILGADENLKDIESGYTPLHVAVFYGFVTCAQVLLDYDVPANRDLDKEGLLPLDIFVHDKTFKFCGQGHQKDSLETEQVEKRPLYKLSDSCEVYSSGENVSYNLGHGQQISKAQPECIEYFRQIGLSIVNVIACQFHSIFQSNSGTVYSCGHGLGGRLGTGDEKTRLLPVKVQIDQNQVIKAVAGGPDHTIFVTESNIAYSCGLNSNHVLGIMPYQETVFEPTQVQISQLKSPPVIIGCGAAKFHSVLYSTNELFTFGVNAGQMGHPKLEKPHVDVPRLCTMIGGRYHQRQQDGTTENHILDVQCSTGSTVLLFSSGDVCALVNYTLKKIASKMIGIKSVRVIGGTLDPGVMKSEHKQTSSELKIFLLMNSGLMYVWTDSKPKLTKIQCSGLRRQIYPVDFSIFSNGFYAVDSYGSGFSFIKSKPRQQSGSNQQFQKEDSPSPTKSSRSWNSKAVEAFEVYKVAKVSHIHRGVAVSCSPDAANVFFIQSHPSTQLTDIEGISDSKIREDFMHFCPVDRLVSSAETALSDFTVTVNDGVSSISFPCHKFILASRCSFFAQNVTSRDYIYTDACRLINPGAKFLLRTDILTQSENISAKKHKPKRADPIELISAAAQRLGLKRLSKELECLLFDHASHTVQLRPHRVLGRPKLRFGRAAFPELADCKLTCSDGKVLMAHRCIMWARLEYFRCMMSSQWTENSTGCELSFPIPSHVLSDILYFVYTDDLPSLTNTGLPNFDKVCQLLVHSDHFLLCRLREKCEVALAGMLTLQDAPQLLEFASTYNAMVLHKAAVQFICLNLDALLEVNALQVVSRENLDAISKYYISFYPAVSRRVTSAHTPVSPAEREQADCTVAMFQSLGLAIDDVTQALLQANARDGQAASIESRKARRNRARNASLRLSQSTSTPSDGVPITCRQDSCTNSQPQPSSSVQTSGSSTPNLVQMQPDKKRKGQGTVEMPETQLSYFEKKRAEAKTVSVKDNPAKHTPVMPKPWCTTRDLECSASEDPAVVSLQQIMTDEMKKTPNRSTTQPQTNSVGKHKRYTLQWPLEPTMSPKSDPVSVPSTSQPKNPWKIPSLDSPSTSSRDTTWVAKSPVASADLFSAPVASSPEANTSMSFSEIQQFEEKQEHAKKVQENKPLLLIQIEEQAIRELEQFYQMDTNFDERLTIERVSAVPAAIPIWKTSTN